MKQLMETKSAKMERNLLFLTMEQRLFLKNLKRSISQLLSPLIKNLFKSSIFLSRRYSKRHELNEYSKVSPGSFETKTSHFHCFQA